MRHPGQWNRFGVENALDGTWTVQRLVLPAPSSEHLAPLSAVGMVLEDLLEAAAAAVEREEEARIELSD